MGNLVGSSVKTLKKKIKLAARRGLTKTMESTVYGRTDRISERNISSDSAIAVAARKLKIKAHHMYFRTFVRAVKVSSAKPYATSMVRANGINIVSLLLDNAKDAKKAYAERVEFDKQNPEVRGPSPAQEARDAFLKSLLS